MEAGAVSAPPCAMRDVNILIADNDPDALAIYGEYLEAAGYRVLKA